MKKKDLQNGRKAATLDDVVCALRALVDSTDALHTKIGTLTTPPKDDIDEVSERMIKDYVRKHPPIPKRPLRKKPIWLKESTALVKLKQVKEALETIIGNIEYLCNDDE